MYTIINIEIDANLTEVNCYKIFVSILNKRTLFSIILFHL